MSIVIKVLLALVIVALAANQLHMYYNIVVLGTYLSTAPIHLVIITGVVWPVAVVAIGGWLVWKIFQFKPSNLD